MQTQITRWLPIWTLFSTNCKVTVWRMKRVKTLPATELDHFLSTEFFSWTNAGNTDKSTSQQQFPIFNAELSRMKRSVELLSRETRIDFQTASSFVYVWMIFTATNFDISSSMFCDAQVKIFHAGSTETIFRISANCSCRDFWQIPLQIVLEALFIFNMIYVHWIRF